MIHGFLVGFGVCLAFAVVAGVLRFWPAVLATLLALVAAVILIVVHATGVADWRLIAIAWALGSSAAFLVLPLAGFDQLRSALFMNAGLVAFAVFLVHHTLPPDPIAANAAPPGSAAAP